MFDRNLHSIKTMLDHIEKVEKFTSDKKSCQDFYDDDECFDASVFNIALIGERTMKLSVDFIKKQDHVNWRVIKDFRNFIIHNYDDLDPEKVWSTVKTSLPKLKTDLLKIIAGDL